MNRVARPRGWPKKVFSVDGSAESLVRLEAMVDPCLLGTLRFVSGTAPGGGWPAPATNAPPHAQGSAPVLEGGGQGMSVTGIHAPARSFRTRGPAHRSFTVIWAG